MKFFHVSSPFIAPKHKDLFFAQPITFDTFTIAKQFSNKELDISQAFICFEEDKKIVPNKFRLLDFLKKSLSDYGDYKFKFPLISELLDTAYRHSTGYDYLVFSNIDISLMPYFYDSICTLIEINGYDSIAINRRSITDRYTKANQIPLMFSELGEIHSGWDCFVFKRSLYPLFDFGKSVIGAVGSGRVIHSNLKFYSKNFLELKNSHLTFHLGFSETKDRQYKEIEWVKANLHNNLECSLFLNKIINEEQSNNKDSWIFERLNSVEIRTKKYNEVLNPSKKIMGYWILKRMLYYFGFIKGRF